jgi:hypothetical protein
MSDIFREVDEELRRDRFEVLWQRYGAWIIAAAVLLVAAVAAFTAWREYQQRVGAAEGVEYSAALEIAAAGQEGEAAQTLRSFGAGADSGHKLLARFKAASLQAEAGDAAAAVETLEAIAADGGVDAIYRELATVLAALHTVGEAEPGSIVARLQPIAAGDGPWRASALEVTALAQLRAGDAAAALEAYRRLADDLAAPPSLRARAAEMVQALDG